MTRCPECDAETVRVEPHLRCIACDCTFQFGVATLTDKVRAAHTYRQETAAGEAIHEYLLANIKTPPYRIVKGIRDFIAPATFRALYPDAQSFGDAHPVPGANPIIIRLLWDKFMEATA